MKVPYHSTEGTEEQEHKATQFMQKGQDSFIHVQITSTIKQHPSRSTADGSYRSRAASSIESDFLPGDNEDPGGRERGHVLEVLADVLGGSPQQLGVRALPVVDFPPDAIVHISPEGRNEGPAVRQGEGFWCELADECIEGDHPIVVDLHRDPLLFEQASAGSRELLVYQVSDLEQKVSYGLRALGLVSSLASSSAALRDPGL